MTNPCVTLEQRWSACRAPVYQRRQRLVARVFRWCAMGSRTGHRRPCTSPRRHGCRAGLTQFHGYFTREAWRWQQREAGRRDFPDTDWDRSHNPLAGVRASDWLKELE